MNHYSNSDIRNETKCQESDENVVTIMWEYPDLESDLLPEQNIISYPNHGSSVGAILGFKVHWLLKCYGIHTGAQLVKIGDMNVSCWEYDAIRLHLKKFLSSCGHKALGQRSCLTFRNSPCIPSCKY